MNILHYFLGFPPFHSGGLMIYARDLAIEQLNNGNNVVMLMPGKYDVGDNKSEIKYFSKVKKLPIYQIINGLPVSRGGIHNPKIFMKQVSDNNYEQFLIDMKIDIVHVHSFIGLPREFILIAKELNIKTFYTSHDYYGICPTINLFKHNNYQCKDYNGGLECVKCNESSNESLEIKRRNRCFTKRDILLRKIYTVKFINKSYKHLKSMIFKKNGIYSVSDSQKQTYINNNQSFNDEKSKLYVKLREYYIGLINSIDVLIFNSNTSMKEYSKYVNLKDKEHYIVHVTHKNIKDKRINSNDLRIGPGKIHFTFMGGLNIKKGFFDLLETFEKIKKRYKNWDINIYGDDSMIDVNGYDSEFYQFNGSYTHNELSNIFKKTDILIIPSKWKETFGFIGLEALSYGVPVLCSDNVGFSDLINPDEDGLIYNDINDNQHLYYSIVNLLEKPKQIEKLTESVLRKEFTFGMSEHLSMVNRIYKGKY